MDTPRCFILNRSRNILTHKSTYFNLNKCTFSGICFVEKILQCGMLKRGDFMESFFVALNAVLPMFIMLFIGFLVRKLKILQDSFLPQLNKIVFNVFFPFLMFNNIYGSDFSSVFSPKLLAFAVIGVFTIYFCQSGLHSLLKSQITAVVR